MESKVSGDGRAGSSGLGERERLLWERWRQQAAFMLFRTLLLSRRLRLSGLSWKMGAGDSE
jgi:hypothetical protein